MRGADVIAAKLAAAGCRWVFGIPGGEVLALMDAMREAGLRFVLTKHENPAGFMAEGSWHASGAPGVLLATIGPGVANAVNVIANALQDRVPLIFVTGRVNLADAESYTHQVFDHQALLRPIVKASFCVTPETVGQVMDKALTIACSGQPGPVHIDVPILVAEEPVPESSQGRLHPLRAAMAPGANDAVLQEARAFLAQSTRPLAIAGVDAVNEEAGEAVAAFCRTFRVPLITSYKAKGLLDEADPLAIGGAGLSPRADRMLLPLFSDADLILLLGYDPIEMRAGWRDPWPADKPVVEIAAFERTHAMHNVTHLLQGSVSETLAALGEGVTPQATWTNGVAARTRGALQAAFKADGRSFGPAEVFATLRAALPPETVATADSGAHRILLSQQWPCPAPRTLLQSSALCTMGCALPLAMGHKLASPETPTGGLRRRRGARDGLGRARHPARPGDSGDHLRPGRREPGTDRAQATLEPAPQSGRRFRRQRLPCACRDLRRLWRVDRRCREPGTRSPGGPEATALHALRLPHRRQSLRRQVLIPRLRLALDSRRHDGALPYCSMQCTVAGSGDSPTRARARP